MSASYWVLISDELMAAGVTWPDGMRVTGPGYPGGPRDRGAMWYRMEDDGAPPGLDGRRVELTFRMEGDVPVVASREALS